MAVEDSATPTFPDTSASLLYEFLSESMTGSEAQIDVSGITGSRERRAQAMVDGPIEVTGSIEMYLTPIDIDTWAPRLIGGAKQAGVPSAGQDTFDMAEALPEFGILIDKVATNGSGTTFAYKGCKVSRCVIAGSAGNPVTMTVDILGKTRTYPGETFPASQAYPETAHSQPYVFHESTFTYDSLAFEYNAFELIIDNVAEARLENQQTAEEICATDQIVSLNLNVPWIDTFAPKFDLVDKTGNLQFSKGGNLFTDFQFGELIQITRDPQIGGKQRIPWNLSLEARLSADGLTPAIKIVNDSTV